ncbi:MAG: HigA family addiction module antitoxin [Pseudolabrys sp.]
MTKKEFAPVTPGEMLKEEFLAKYGLSQNQLAKAIGISPNRITESVNIVDALRQTLRSGSAFISEFWMNLQSHYDLKMHATT